MKNINIALLGFGTVGSGVAETIKRNSDIIKERLGVHLLIKYVLVREVNKYTKFPVLKDIHLTDNFSEIIEDKSLDIIVEVMGGITPSQGVYFQCIRAWIERRQRK